MAQRDKISVIIPVFNAEKTLERCVSSVLAQTYTELEVLLIDDGSTDRSPAICDSYQTKDRRVCVVHQPNTGVSDARNKGLQIAKGSWIAWVDADDWIETEMLERLLDACREKRADLAVCKLRREGKKITELGFDEEKTLTGREARKLLLEDRELFSYLWDKLFRRELFGDIVFPPGRKYEDQTVLFRIMGQAARVACIPYCGYHYMDTEGSTVHTYSLRNALDYYLAVRENRKDAEGLGAEYRNAALQNLLRAVIPVWSFASVNRGDPAIREFRTLFPEMLETLRENRTQIRNCARTGILGKAILYGIVLFGEKSPVCMRPMGELYCRRHGNSGKRK